MQRNVTQRYTVLVTPCGSGPGVLRPTSRSLCAYVPVPVPACDSRDPGIVAICFLLCRENLKGNHRSPFYCFSGKRYISQHRQQIMPKVSNYSGVGWVRLKSKGIHDFFFNVQSFVNMSTYFAAIGVMFAIHHGIYISRTQKRKINEMRFLYYYWYWIHFNFNLQHHTSLLSNTYVHIALTCLNNNVS